MALEEISLSVDVLSEFLAGERLSETYAKQADDYYPPILAKILSSISAGNIRVLGINSSQGSGKSTLAKLLRWTLERELGWRVAELSIPMRRSTPCTWGIRCSSRESFEQ